MLLSLGSNLERHMGEVSGVEIKPSKFSHFVISTNNLEVYLQHLNDNKINYSSLGGAKKDFMQKRTDGVRQKFIQDTHARWVEINDVN